jgi:CO/xanthine dehydrogenase FAD-binding subunit
MTLELLRPRSLEEACTLLAEKEGARPLAGGTDILSSQERGTPLPSVLVCLDGLGLTGIQEEPAGGLRLGPFVTHAAVARSPYLRSLYPVLADACASLGSPQVRNLGTLGGNLCNASPAADAASALLALGASVEITGLGGKKLLPVESGKDGPGTGGDHQRHYTARPRPGFRLSEAWPPQGPRDCRCRRGSDTHDGRGRGQGMQDRSCSRSADPAAGAAG